MKSTRKFNDSIKSLFNTPNGLYILNELKVAYVDPSVKSADPNETYYKIGRQDIIKELIEISQTEEQLMKILSN